MPIKSTHHTYEIQALVSANNQQLHYGDILNSTRCLVFFGTPHEGVDAAIWAGYLGKLVRGLGIESTGVMQELKRWSNPLVELKTSFAQLAPRFLIRTFFETHSLHNVLVSDNPSLLNVGLGINIRIRLSLKALLACRMGTNKLSA